jgi:hypothetical protein
VNGFKVDLVPARRQGQYGNDHSLYLSKRNTWTKTNIQKHISIVSKCGKCPEIRLLKLWRDRWGLDFPSTYLELTTIRALKYRTQGRLADNFVAALEFFRDNLQNERIVDPANSANVISDDTTATAKATIARAAAESLKTNWSAVIV